MKLKDDEFIVEPDDPFKNDILERKEIAINIAQLLGSLDIPFVMSISSSWGTGKTTFVRMLQQHLVNNNIQALYFNAWESDFTDPLIGFISEIQEQIVNDLGDKSEKARKQFEKAKKVGLSVAKRAVPAAVKLATAGLLNLDEITEDILSGVAEELAKAGVEEFKLAKESISEFRIQLEKFASDIIDDGSGPIVVFVDELDRCRPSYSIALLERIKHLFNVRGMVFVLVLDRNELANVIRAQYGLEDTSGYLSRFIDLEYRLPEASIEQFATMLFDRLDVKSFFKDRHNSGYEYQELFESVVDFSMMFDSSLRSLERCLTQIAIILRTTPKTKLLFPSFAAFLVVLKIRAPQKYDAFVSRNISGQDLLKYVKTLPSGAEYFSKSKSTHVEAHLATSFIEYEDRAVIKSLYQSKIDDGKLPEEERNRAAKMVRVLERLYSDENVNIVKYLVAKIELVQNFVSSSQ